MSTQFSERVTFSAPVVVGKSINLPDEQITSKNIKSGENVDQDKLGHRHLAAYSQPQGSPVSAETRMIHLARKAGTVKAAKARIGSAPTGDNTLTIDIQKASDGGSFSSILSATVDIDSGNSANEVVELTLSGTPTVAVDDAIRVVCTLSGGTGSHTDDLMIVVEIDEDGA